MAVKLNLLPEEFMLTGPLGRIVKFVRPLNVILLAIFLITALGMVGFFIFSSVSLNNLQSGNSSLTSQIQTQSAAQQQVVLLKDRLGKIKTIKTFPGAAKNLTDFDQTLTSLSASSLLTELDVDSQKIGASILFKSNTDLTNFVKSLRSNTAFSRVLMTTFNYSPSFGYQLGISFTKK